MRLHVAQFSFRTYYNECTQAYNSVQSPFTALVTLAAISCSRVTCSTTAFKITTRRSVILAILFFVLVQTVHNNHWLQLLAACQNCSKWRDCITNVISKCTGKVPALCRTTFVTHHNQFKCGRMTICMRQKQDNFFSSFLSYTGTSAIAFPN